MPQVSPEFVSALPPARSDLTSVAMSTPSVLYPRSLKVQ